MQSLVEEIEQALVVARETHRSQIVDQDGECCFHVTPSGVIILMLPWKRFEIIREG